MKSHRQRGREILCRFGGTNATKMPHGKAESFSEASFFKTLSSKVLEGFSPFLCFSAKKVSLMANFA